MESLEPRNILVVVVVGRKTHILPILEICHALHLRGHLITLAVMEGQLATLPTYIAQSHTVCKPMDPSKDVAMHQEIGEAIASTRKGRQVLSSALKFFDSFYPEVYQNLRPLIAPDLKTPRFDFILADFLDIAAIDLALEFNIPYATCTPQLSFPQGLASFIPGLPGLQQHVLTSEHATLGERVYETWFALVFLIDMLPWFRARQTMRKMHTGGRGIKEGEHLHLVNSFWGFDVPRVHKPLLCLVGPLVPDTWDPLTSELSEFFSCRSSVVYVAFGSLASLPASRFSKLRGALRTLLANGHIDGVIWSIKNIPVTSDDDTVGAKGADKDMLLLPWVPQRAVLAHGAIKLFLTHAGTGSVNEGLYHGLPMLCMPIHGDQNACALRCEAAGVGLRMDKNGFTAGEAVSKAMALLEDREGQFKTDCLRMQRLAATRASIGRELAASMIQEVMYDHELGLRLPNQPRPPHLQVPSDRMPFWKRKNLDLYTLGPVVAAYQGCSYLLRGLADAVSKLL